MDPADNKPAGQRDIAGRSFWDQLWRTPPALRDPRAPGLANRANRAFHEAIRQALADRPTRGMPLLELGCAHSIWLPYFAREHGFAVTGLDYSEAGCRHERELLAAAGVEGEIVCADLFAPPERLIGRFDVVASFGLVEHFTDTADCLRASARFLRPGGRMITSVPNLSGLLGTVQKRLDRAVYDIHVPLDLTALAAAHEAAGLRATDARYLMSSNFGILSFGAREAGLPFSLFRKGLSGLTAAFWLAEDIGLKLRPNRLTSPYILCIADKPA